VSLSTNLLISVLCTLLMLFRIVAVNVLMFSRKLVFQRVMLNFMRYSRVVLLVMMLLSRKVIWMMWFLLMFMSAVVLLFCAIVWML